MERIDKILSSQNIGSRREIKQLIRQGAVLLNGVAVKRPEEKTNPDTDIITVNGVVLNFKRNLYIMMNKPAGVLSATRDNRQKTVLDLIPEELKRRDLFPAGRLDKDTEGLLIITDDGALAHDMLSPTKHVYKLYEAEVDRALTENDCLLFRNGITIGEQSFLPAEIKLISSTKALVRVREGKFHQIKRMFEAVGTHVLTLKRLRIGDLWLDKALLPGECRELTADEIPLLISHNDFSL